MKWAYFAVETHWPTHVNAGEIRVVEDDVFEMLRARISERAVLNVTPRPIELALKLALGLPPFYEQPASRTRIMPCPECMMFDRVRGRFIPAKRYTYCMRCDGLQSVVMV